MPPLDASAIPAQPLIKDARPPRSVALTHPTQVHPSRHLNECLAHASLTRTAVVRPMDVITRGELAAVAGALGLSPRESELVECFFQDETGAAVARALGLSESTVHTYRERLYRKLGVASPCQVLAVVFATHVLLSRRSLASG